MAPACSLSQHPFSTKGLEKSLCDFTACVNPYILNHVTVLSRDAASDETVGDAASRRVKRDITQQFVSVSGCASHGLRGVPYEFSSGTSPGHLDLQPKTHSPASKN